MSKILGWMDRVSGVGDLGASQARRLRASQLMSVINMAPIATVGAVLALSVIVASMWESAHLTETLVVCALIAILQGLSLQKYFQFKKTGGPREIRLQVLFKVALSGAMFGGLWGLLSLWTIQYAEPSWLLIIGILLGGILLTTIYCFRTVFLGAASFILVSGIFLAVALLSRPEFVGTNSAIVLTAAYFGLMPRLAFKQMRDFVDHCVAELKSAADAQISDALLLQFEEAGDEWFWATNADGYVELASNDLRKMLSQFNESYVDRSVQTYLSDCDRPGSTGLTEALKEKADFKNIRICFDVDGQDRWLAFSGQRSLDDDGCFNGFIGVCVDVTNELLAEEKIVEMAMLDGLTGLQNRTYFYESIDRMVSRLERYGTSFSLMFLDLDKFKLVNDTYGHHVGDGLLKEAASRLKSVLRDNDMVGRLGGDEFAIIVEETCDPVFIAKLASRIIQEISAPYFVDGETLYIGVSVGVALAPMHGTQREQLLRNADLALYRAKDDGRGVFRYFEAQMDFEQRERRMLEQEMRQALIDDEFEMKFQPMVSTKDGKVTCMEALIRWNHEIRGSLSPDEFISIAEQSNLIVDVGRWSLLSACKTARTWPDNVSVAVNISALHFMRSDIVADVDNALRASGLSACRLEVEITESILIEDNDATFTKLNGLRELGVTIAMDDFGTGYSSLGYLTKFRFDRLKIDKSFLIDMDTDDHRKAIVYTIAALGENLGINITVEGVETIEHVNFLKTICCDQAQGYYYSRPLSKDDVPAFLLRTFSEAIAAQPAISASSVGPRTKQLTSNKTAKVA